MGVSDRLVAQKALGFTSAPPFHWELGSNIWMARNKFNQDLLPCITKSHTIWDVRRGQPWLGKQLLWAQGFPRDMKRRYNPEDSSIPKHIHDAISMRLNGKTYVSDADLKKMAGNTMTVPIMGLLQVTGHHLFPQQAVPSNHVHTKHQTVQSNASAQ